MIQPSWKAFFIFSNKEIKGIIALGFILLGSVCISLLFPRKSINANNPSYVNLHPFNFDPNTIDSLQAIQLGIPAKQVSNLMHYRAKGGYFKSKQDFSKLYGLSPALFAALSPYIIVANQENPKWVSKKHSVRYYKDNNISLNKDEWKIDMNAASANDWLQKTALPNYLIQRIMAYKEYRGAFTKPSELAKVYGLSDSIYQLLRGHLFVNNKTPHLLNATAMQFQDWKALNIFSDPQIWNILKLKRSMNGKLIWAAMIEALDLTKAEAEYLRQKVKFSD
jgi:DNA uptake protein ComE-like DNA-binding protein